jgi:hypothetical protein
MDKRRLKQTSTLQGRLENEAKRLREESMKLPLGDKRQTFLEKIRELEIPYGVVEWINSPGLKPPA